LPISLVKHINCLLSSNSLAISFADTCSNNGLGSYIIAGSGDAFSVVIPACKNTASKETITTLDHRFLFRLINLLLW
jgi:hypothetical protein